MSESVKNILFLMKSDGYLVPPSSAAQDRPIWQETWRRLDRFLPGMRKEIFPDSGPGKEQRQAPQQQAASAGAGKYGEKTAEGEVAQS